MSTKNKGASFDDIIQAGRTREKNKALASEIFGRGRLANSAQAKDRPPQVGSLASRITPAGVGKRSASANSIKQVKGPSRQGSAAAQKSRAERIGAAIINDSSLVQTVSQDKSRGISIRGISSAPFHVQASNFAPGTTAADIESALLSIANGATETSLTSCRIMTSAPTVIAEMIFTDRGVAEEVVNAWNGQRADGRLLHVHWKDLPVGPNKRGGVLQSSRMGRNSPKPAPPAEELHETPSSQPPKELIDLPPTYTAMEDVEVSAPKQDTHQDPERNETRVRDVPRAEPDIQDGTYGFAEPAQTQETARLEEAKRPPPYRGDGRPDGDRGYNRDRDQDRRYDDRGQFLSRGASYQREGNGYSGRNTFHPREDWRDRRPPGPPYGNGISGRGNRGAGYHGGGDRYGRMYSDDMMRRGGRQRPGYG